MVRPRRTPRLDTLPYAKGNLMNNIIYIVGLIVIIIAVLSFFGLR
jgi:small-conductance mechanosensitive channel